MPPGEVQPRTVQQHIARLAPLVRPPEVCQRRLVVFLRRCRITVNGKFCIHRLVCHFDDGRKFLSRDVDTVPTVGYTTYRTITQKLSGRYCKPESAKKRDGSFFVRKQNVTLRNERCGVCFRVCAVYLLHIVQNKSVLPWTQIEHRKDRLTVLRIDRAKQHQTAVPAFARAFASQNQNRVIQQFRNLLNLPDCHFWMFP